MRLKDAIVLLLIGAFAGGLGSSIYQTAHAQHIRGTEVGGGSGPQPSCSSSSGGYICTGKNGGQEITVGDLTIDKVLNVNESAAVLVEVETPTVRTDEIHPFDPYMSGASMTLQANDGVDGGTPGDITLNPGVDNNSVPGFLYFCPNMNCESRFGGPITTSSATTGQVMGTAGGALYLQSTSESGGQPIHVLAGDGTASTNLGGLNGYGGSVYVTAGNGHTGDGVGGTIYITGGMSDGSGQGYLDGSVEIDSCPSGAGPTCNFIDLTGRVSIDVLGNDLTIYDDLGAPQVGYTGTCPSGLIVTHGIVTGCSS